MKVEYKVAPGAGGLPRLTLAAPDGARAEIYLYGAQVVSWVPAGEEERLFLSRVTPYKSGVPIRGGIPVVFPQFGGFGPLPAHGFARLFTWELAGVEESGEGAAATFHLRDSEESRKLWPHAFLAELVVTIGGSRLEAALSVTNTGEMPFEFMAALHTYFRVSNAGETLVEGLAGLRYQDAAAGGVEKLDESGLVRFTGEVNRIYFGAPEVVRLVEPGSTMMIRKTGFRDGVVWNPAATRCAAMPDLEPEDYQRFVCVEAATVGVPVELEPGKRWSGSQELEHNPVL